MQCSICLDDLDASGPTLACGHRFHASCLARLAGANGTTPTRRGALTACPNCRTRGSAPIGTRAGAVVPETARAPPNYGKCIEGAKSKANGKWTNYETFPGREFDDLDAYRAAKKQRKEQRAAYSEQHAGRRR